MKQAYVFVALGVALMVVVVGGISLIKRKSGQSPVPGATPQVISTQDGKITVARPEPAGGATIVAKYPQPNQATNTTSGTNGPGK